MNITIAQLAADYNSQPFEIAAALDIAFESDDQEITEYTEAEAREILNILATQAADLHE